MIEVILIYILIGVIFATVFGWDKTKEVFERSEYGSQNSLTKHEWREYIFLITTYILGWGVFAIYIFIINPVKTLFIKK